MEKSKSLNEMEKIYFLCAEGGLGVEAYFFVQAEGGCNEAKRYFMYREGEQGSACVVGEIWVVKFSNNTWRVFSKHEETTAFERCISKEGW